jgi:ATP-dependent DNA helicase RecG
MESAKDLIEKLNLSDECTTIEAKRATNIHRSVLESVCAFTNEPGLGGGNILLGVGREENSLFPFYTVFGVEKTDKLQLDLSTQCADMFNQPIRPEISVETINDKNVINVFVPELPQSQNPVYFKSEGLPKGAFRRIGSSDQRCTDDDLFIFYNQEDSLDSSIIKDTSLNDISEEAVQLYRTLRGRVNPFAEELQYNDIDLLQSLGCIKRENDDWRLTYTGLLVFGKRQSHRRLLPMVRVDYIRVPGNEWVADPENRFTTIDMRGPLIELVQRTFSAIADDLPKGFLLPEGETQADSIGLPTRVLREAIVNAFLHRTYRENQPIQIIRYGNRLEIKNPGFSLKPEEQLGDPGSRNRNPFIAAIFMKPTSLKPKAAAYAPCEALWNGPP